MERRELLCTAAVSLLAAGGPRALTHRAVDRAAGVPLGSTSNLFRTRQSLVSAVVDSLVQADHHRLGRLEGESPRTAEGLATALAHFVSAAGTTGQEYARARQALLVHASDAPSSAAALAEGRSRLIAWGTDALRSIGATRPEEKSALIVGMVDGMIGATVFMDLPVGESALASAITAIISDP
ncbi:TetR/AcrR family transcriptional regulator [Arthrobacter sp. B0490]|uniref:TetR/AcrR family transcriptional regulator n=1 Tax=Arthrobacter sp. B0490 TaxID=2058891 RepID=UPI0011AFD315|nr:TetR/AcrR family transcriptional regulator [Arthrobacter sp. B0490]